MRVLASKPCCEGLDAVPSFALAHKLCCGSSSDMTSSLALSHKLVVVGDQKATPRLSAHTPSYEILVAMHSFMVAKQCCSNRICNVQYCQSKPIICQQDVVVA